MKFDFNDFSMITVTKDRGLQVMALTERPEIELNEQQRAPVGFEANIYYQQAVVILENSPNDLLIAIREKIVEILAREPQS